MPRKKQPRKRGEEEFKELTKIDILSLARIQTILMAIAGFLTALFQWILFQFLKKSPAYQQLLSQGMKVDIPAETILIAPLVWGIAGFFTGIIGGFLYNTVARAVGGIKVKLS